MLPDMFTAAAHFRIKFREIVFNFECIRIQLKIKNHERKIQLKSIFIDEFEISLQTNQTTLQNGPNIFSNFACLVMITNFQSILNRMWLFAFHGHKRIFIRPNNKSVSVLFVCDCICIFRNIKAQFSMHIGSDQSN